MTTPEREREYWDGRVKYCGQPSQSIGVDGHEMRAPLRPASADPGFGLGLLGFSVRVQLGDGDRSN